MNQVNLNVEKVKVIEKKEPFHSTKARAYQWVNWKYEDIERNNTFPSEEVLFSIRI
jgi:hypothetical protein